MWGKAFLADEHVPRAYVWTLRSSGFTVERVGEDYPVGIDDVSLLDAANSDGLVLLTNDRDFVELAQKRPHGGVVIDTDQGLEAADFVASVRRIDAYLAAESLVGEVLLLRQWRSQQG